MSQTASQSIAILGRQPAIGLAELESLYGEKVSPLGNQAALIEVAPSDITYTRLGGALKLAKLLTILDFTDWQKISDYLVRNVPLHTKNLESGKLIFGLSVYGIKANDKAIERTALAVKKAVRATDGRSVRVVPTKNKELSSAQILHNKMTQSPFGMELLLVQHKGQTYLAQTVATQDIEAYAARDQARPKRDARVGMLPPKLAQVIVNLAVGPDAENLHTILDPFCGTGVILQEALLMGFDVVGSDLEPRMIEYSRENLEWLKSDTRVTGNFALEVGDATDTKWTEPIDAIACETYLGRPFSVQPKPEILQEVMSDVATIHQKFLQNVARQTKSGVRITIAVPAWNVGGHFKHLKTLDSLEELGYTRVSFAHVANEELIYHREGQIVGRELVTLVRK